MLIPTSVTKAAVGLPQEWDGTIAMHITKIAAHSIQVEHLRPAQLCRLQVGQGCIAHLEGETMNAFVPSTLAGDPDSGRREWVWSFMTGIKKEYRIYKNPEMYSTHSIQSF